MSRQRTSLIDSASALLVLAASAASAAGLMAEVRAAEGEGQEVTPAEWATEMRQAEADGSLSFRDGTRPLQSSPQDLVDELSSLLRSLPDAPAASTRAVLEVFKDPKALSIPYEFALLTVDGQLSKVFVVSTGAPGKYTIEGSYSLKIPMQAGTHGRAPKPFPWLRSSKYQNSPMFWGLQISGGYFAHSTPHYGQLGRRASMGCVRLSHPSAMDLFDTVVNRVDGSAVVHIYGSGSREARTALESKGLDQAWLVQQIQNDLDDAHAVTTHDYGGVGHARRGQPLVYPSCDGVDCFEYFGKLKP